MLEARRDNLSRQTLSNLDRLNDASSLGHESRKIRTGRQVDAVVNGLDMEADDSFIASIEFHLGA